MVSVPAVNDCTLLRASVAFVITGDPFETILRAYKFPPIPTPPATCKAPDAVELAFVGSLIITTPFALIPPLEIHPVFPPLYELNTHDAYAPVVGPIWRPLPNASDKESEAVFRYKNLSPDDILVPSTINCVPSTYKFPDK